MRSSLSDAQDRILKSYSHDAKGASANSAVAIAIELGKQNKRSFTEDTMDNDTQFSFASPEYFANYLETKKATAEAARPNNKTKKKKK